MFDYIRLSLKAAAIVYRTMQEGERKHGRAKWKRASKQEHLKHACDHVIGIINGNTKEDHVGHAITRLVMYKEAGK